MRRSASELANRSLDEHSRPDTVRAVQLDRQEAQLREQQRAAQAAKAQAAIWQQTDVARAVRAQLLLSEVMAERALQLAEAQHMRQLQLRQDEHHFRNLLASAEASLQSCLTACSVPVAAQPRLVQAAKLREEAQAQQLRDKAESARQVQLQQLEEVKQAILRER